MAETCGWHVVSVRLPERFGPAPPPTSPVAAAPRRAPDASRGVVACGWPCTFGTHLRDSPEFPPPPVCRVARSRRAPRIPGASSGIAKRPLCIGPRGAATSRIRCAEFTRSRRWDLACRASLPVSAVRLRRRAPFARIPARLRVLPRASLDEVSRGPRAGLTPFRMCRVPSERRRAICGGASTKAGSSKTASRQRGGGGEIHPLPGECPGEGASIH